MIKLRVREVAEQKGILQSHLQMQAHVTGALLSRYWHNKTRLVSLDELGKIARVLGVPARELISDTSDL